MPYTLSSKKKIKRGSTVIGAVTELTDTATGDVKSFRWSRDEGQSLAAFRTAVLFETDAHKNHLNSAPTVTEDL